MASVAAVALSSSMTSALNASSAKLASQLASRQADVQCVARVRMDSQGFRLRGRLGSSGGAGVLERPGLDQSRENADAPKTDAGGDMAQLRQRMRTGGGDKYRVLLLDDERHTEDRVTKVLPTVVPAVTAEDARRLFNESRELGQALVTLAVKEHAEFYAQTMAMRGLRATIQPDGFVL